MQLVQPPLQPSSPCKLGYWECLWQQSRTQLLSILIGGPLFLVLLVWFLLWLSKPSPSGWLRSRKNNKDQIPLSEVHSFMSKLLHKSVINSSEIENHPDAGNSLKFGVNTSFQLIFTRNGKTYIRLTKDNKSTISLRHDQLITLSTNKPESELRVGDILMINGEERASYQLGPRTASR